MPKTVIFVIFPILDQISTPDPKFRPPPSELDPPQIPARTTPDPSQDPPQIPNPSQTLRSPDPSPPDSHQATPPSGAWYLLASRCRRELSDHPPIVAQLLSRGQGRPLCLATYHSMELIVNAYAKCHCLNRNTHTTRIMLGLNFHTESASCTPVTGNR